MVGNTLRRIKAKVPSKIAKNRTGLSSRAGKKASKGIAGYKLSEAGDSAAYSVSAFAIRIGSENQEQRFCDADARNENGADSLIEAGLDRAAIGMARNTAGSGINGSQTSDTAGARSRARRKVETANLNGPKANQIFKVGFEAI